MADFTEMLSAIAVILMYFDFPIPIIAPGFYKIDFSEVPVLIGSFMLGPCAGVVIEAVKVILHFCMKGTTTAFAPGRRGTAHLIKKNKPIVIPVVIDGFRTAFDKKGLRIKKRGINATMTFKEPLEIDYENESSDVIMQRIMNAIEQSPEFNKVRPVDEILAENREKSLDDYLNEDDEEEFDDFEEMGYDEENKKD